MAAGNPNQRSNSFKDKTGQRFGMLTVLSLDSVCNQHSTWLVRCDCGTEKTVLGSNLKATRSCGCYRKPVVRKERPGVQEKRKRLPPTSGVKVLPEYGVWTAMCRRCNNPNAKEYHRYGGRGIRVCDRWTGKGGFPNFLADMGRRPSAEHSIERRDNGGHYSPDNCVWATDLEQCNNKRNNHFITANGQTMTIAQWSRHLGVAANTIKSRLATGKYTDEEVVSLPFIRGSEQGSRTHLHNRVQCT